MDKEIIPLYEEEEARVVRPKKIKRILSFDPGLTALGWAVSDWHNTKADLQVIKYGHLKASYEVNKAIKKHDNLKKYKQRDLAILYIYKFICKLIEKYKPDAVVCEGTFYSHPTSYSALVGVTTAISLSANKYHIPLYQIPPKSIKLGISNDGTSGKEAVQNAVRSNEHIILKGMCEKRADQMVSHEADAISCGFTFANNHEFYSSQQLLKKKKKKKRSRKRKW